MKKKVIIHVCDNPNCDAETVPIKVGKPVGIHVSQILVRHEEGKKPKIATDVYVCDADCLRAFVAATL